MRDETHYHRLHRMFSENMTTADICAATGFSAGTIYAARSKLKRLKTPEAVREWDRQDKEKMRRMNGVPPRDVYMKVRANANGKRNRGIIRAIEGGATYGDAARIFGVSRNVVAGVMNRYRESR